MNDIEFQKVLFNLPVHSLTCWSAVASAEVCEWFLCVRMEGRRARHGHHDSKGLHKSHSHHCVFQVLKWSDLKLAMYILRVELGVSPSYSSYLYLSYFYLMYISLLLTENKHICAQIYTSLPTIFCFLLGELPYSCMSICAYTLAYIYIQIQIYRYIDIKHMQHA